MEFLNKLRLETANIAARKKVIMHDQSYSTKKHMYILFLQPKILTKRQSEKYSRRHSFIEYSL